MVYIPESKNRISYEELVDNIYGPEKQVRAMLNADIGWTYCEFNYDYQRKDSRAAGTADEFWSVLKGSVSC